MNFLANPYNLITCGIFCEGAGAITAARCCDGPINMFQKVEIKYAWQLLHSGPSFALRFFRRIVSVSRAVSNGGVGFSGAKFARSRVQLLAIAARASLFEDKVEECAAVRRKIEKSPSRKDYRRVPMSGCRRAARQDALIGRFPAARLASPFGA